MIALIASVSAALAGGLELDRVDLLSESSPRWLRDDAPRIAVAPGLTAVRFAEQLGGVVAAGPVELGASLDAQWIGLAAPLIRERTLFVDGALVTRAFLPTGARAGLAWRPGRVRIGVSLVAEAGATWGRPSYRSWSVLPALGVGVGRDLRPRAPWM